MAPAFGPRPTPADGNSSSTATTPLRRFSRSPLTGTAAPVAALDRAIGLVWRATPPLSAGGRVLRRAAPGRGLSRAGTGVRLKYQGRRSSPCSIRGFLVRLVPYLDHMVTSPDPALMERCPRCLAASHTPAFRYVVGGLCFLCWGSGVVSARLADGFARANPDMWGPNGPTVYATHRRPENSPHGTADSSSRVVRVGG